MSTQPLDAPVRRPRWPWVMLGLGLIWTVLIRVPLVLNAEDHLDSDLAVDGLTLRDVVHGHWRWHYPGTPYMGILPVLASYPQALIWGANPITLVSGGTVIWLLVVGSTFWLASVTYGLEVAGWAILPLVFSSLGTIWLSGRITGGHLLTLFWHTAAFGGLYLCLNCGGWRRAAALGLWCGLGLYLDTMFVFTLAGLTAAALLTWLSTGRPRAGIGLGAVFLIALSIGAIPREVGQWVDPYDAYPSQFAAILEPGAIWQHLRLLMLHCLPRLIASGGWPATIMVSAFPAAFIRVARDSARSPDHARGAIRLGTCASALLIILAFLVNRHVYNSDNYRYLIFLLTPWALGFGLILSHLASRGLAGGLAAGLIGVLLLGMMTLPTLFWYRDERHYVDARGMPVRLRLPEWSELTILRDGERGTPIVSADYAVPRDVSHVFGGYWDVYKMAFLSGGHVVGIPFPMFPNRFPGWSYGLGAGRGKLLVLRPELLGASSGSASTRRPRRAIVRSAAMINWQSPLTAKWTSEGRDPAELSHLQVVVP